MFSTWKPVNDNFNKCAFSHGTVSTNKFKYLWGDPLLGPPLLKKGPLNLQKGAHSTLIGQFLEYTLVNNV